MNIITKEQDLMIDMILQGETISDIAKKIGVTRQTIYSWKEKSIVVAELEKRKSLLKKSARDRITKDILTYVDSIKDLALNSSDQRVRLQASKYLVDQCLGTPTTTKEEMVVSDDKNKDSVTALEKRLEDIKNLKVVK